MPDVKHPQFEYPKLAYQKKPKRPFESTGEVRSKVNFPSLDPQNTIEKLCKNYFNKAVQDLVRRAKRHGGDAVIDVKSVVFLMNGEVELQFVVLAELVVLYDLGIDADALDQVHIVIDYGCGALGRFYDWHLRLLSLLRLRLRLKACD